MNPGEELFDGRALEIYRVVADEVCGWDGIEVRVARTQVVFRRRRGFGYCWDPRVHLRTDVPLVVSFALPREASHDRIKEVVHPSRTTWMHHIEIRSTGEVDEVVLGYLREAWEAAATERWT